MHLLPGYTDHTAAVAVHVVMCRGLLQVTADRSKGPACKTKSKLYDTHTGTLQATDPLHFMFSAMHTLYSYLSVL